MPTFTDRVFNDHVACVTVTFFPDIKMLRSQLVALSPRTVAIVDNSAAPDVKEELNALAAEFTNVHVVFNERNLGLAAGLNLGVRVAKANAPSTTFALLLDQDSEPTSTTVEKLIKAFLALEEDNQRVGLVGPKIVDVDTGLQHGFHTATRFRWMRRYPCENETDPISCANINGSGSLLRTDLFLAMGGLDEGFFIDHVDTEWSFRLLAAGYTLWGIPGAEIRHRMGVSGARFWWFGWRVWPMRSPIRHYYLFRNAVWLFKRESTPRVWIAWNIAKLFLTAIVHAVVDAEREAQLKQMYRGVKAGIIDKCP